MKREIKFRVWTGNSMEYNIMAGFLGAFYVQGIDEKDSASMSPFNTKYPDDISLMQFTGEKDKDDKDIYEGDILKLSDPYNETEAISEVKYINGSFTIEADGWFNGGESDVTSVGWAKEEDISMKIIGNIYDNPELLK